MLTACPLDHVAELDLSFALAKLTDSEGQFRWSQDRAEHAIDGYKDFLQAVRDSGCQRRRVPSQEVDEVWHIHILSTRRYAADCELIFGNFLHHEPQAKHCDCSGCGAGCNCDGGE